MYRTHAPLVVSAFFVFFVFLFSLLLFFFVAFLSGVFAQP